MTQTSTGLWDRTIRRAYRLTGRVMFRNPDQGEWIYERIRRPRTVFAAAMNVVAFKLKIPRIWAPVSMQIEPVYGCNLKCKYCWGSGAIVAKRPHLMSQEVFRAIADHLPDTIESVTFSLTGEPLLHPDLESMIEYMHSKGRRIVMFSNGTRLTGDRIRSVARLPLSVLNISIEPDAATARENRGIDLDQIRENVRELHRIKRPEMELKASCVITPNNVEQLPQIRSYWDGLISQFKFAPCFYEFGDEPPSMCLELWRGNIDVHTGGNVSLCCFDPNGELVVGNVLETDLRQIINGPPMRALLKSMVDGRPPARCLRCHQFETAVAPLRAPKGQVGRKPSDDR
jgi:MoaA/NifB/PqqE/SkfB family radical SAM enzyme